MGIFEYLHQTFPNIPRNFWGLVLGVLIFFGFFGLKYMLAHKFDEKSRIWNWLTHPRYGPRGSFNQQVRSNQLKILLPLFMLGWGYIGSQIYFMGDFDIVQFFLIGGPIIFIGILAFPLYVKTNKAYS